VKSIRSRRCSASRLCTRACSRSFSEIIPTSVRDNAIERAVALTRYERLVIEDLPDKIRTYRKSHLLIGSDNPAELVSMDEVERRYIHHVLAAVGGNKTLAARVLVFDCKTLYRKPAQYGLDDQLTP
jgi:two-component system response regulator AtoC